MDDNHLVVKSLSRLLVGVGYDTTAVENGNEALNIIRSKDFDVIILDIRMEGMDGIETAKRIKRFLKEQNKRLIPIIFITGFSDEYAYKEARALPASDFIYKPFDKDVFLKSIEEAILSR